MLIVSRGLGGFELPVRAFAPPDALIVDLVERGQPAHESAPSWASVSARSPRGGRRSPTSLAAPRERRSTRRRGPGRRPAGRQRLRAGRTPRPAPRIRPGVSAHPPTNARSRPRGGPTRRPAGALVSRQAGATTNSRRSHVSQCPREGDRRVVHRESSSSTANLRRPPRIRPGVSAHPPTSARPRRTCVATRRRTRRFAAFVRAPRRALRQSRQWRRVPRCAATPPRPAAGRPRDQAYRIAQPPSATPPPSRTPSALALPNCARTTPRYGACSRGCR